MKRLSVLLAFLWISCSLVVHAQVTQVKGKVTSAEDGSTLPGATVLVTGTKTVTVADADGNYSINVPSDAKSLTFMFIGMKTKEVPIAGQAVINVVMEAEVKGIDEVVVTALGISREKKSLGYSTQEVKGDIVSTVKTNNFINTIAGRVAGMQITQTTNIGGSSNIIVRGNTSLNGNNQALIVVDGVPIDNTITNSRDQMQSGAGYDFGNAASDINPNDIESINVLKGAAASALYGSRASNGVVMITTKKGAAAGVPVVPGVGVEINSNVTVGTVDKSTFPEYQKEYGAGYGEYFIEAELAPGDWASVADDASNGIKFDPNKLVYQWNAVDPTSPKYLKATPWVAAKNGPISLFDNSLAFTNTVSIHNSNERGSYRISGTNYKQNGIMPNSSLKRNNILMNGNWNVNKKLTVSGSANVIRTDGKGRNATGYSDNIMTSFRQWFETNVDIKEQKDAYFRTKRNLTWNYNSPDEPTAAFWDNPYWVLYENYETDFRNRFVGYVSADYKITDWLDIFGRIASDSYYGLEEQRKAVGSVPGNLGIGTGSDFSINQPIVPAGYLRRDINSSEENYDLMININKDITQDISLRAVLGGNSRKSEYNWMLSATNGGLAIPRLYAIQNSIGSIITPKERARKIGVEGIYADVSLGYQKIYYIEATIRRDHSSTLPKSNSTYYYPSVSGNMVFSELLKQPVLSYGKIRLNYAEVGNSAPFGYTRGTYDILTPFNGTAMTAPSNTEFNSKLKPERTKSFEGGLEMNFLNRRVGFDLSLYNTRTIDQILPLRVSRTTGYDFKIINAGEIRNRGVELVINGTPVKTKDFSWDITVNWSKNNNEVVSLYTSATDTVTNMQLGSLQGGVTINARVGQPYGVISGTDYQYLNGQKVVDPETGYYLSTQASDVNLGKVDPDWRGGISNTFTYQNLSMNVLIDIKQGGKIFSTDMYYGLATGLYKETAGKNELGNPVRDPIAYNTEGDPTSGYAPTSGGVINPGVNPDGKPNKTRAEVNPDANATGMLSFGYYHNPNKAFVYDASFVKLREVSLSYSFPTSLLKKTFIRGLTLSAVGSNLWIIHKNLPYADPESGLGAGNIQGYSIGSLPSTRNFGFDVKLTF